MIRFLHSVIEGFSKRPVFWSAAFLVWLALLVWVSMRIPPTGQEQAFPQQDKVLHFVFFSGGGVVLAALLRLTTRLRPWLLVFAATLVLSLLGAADEYHQQFVPGRDGLSLADWIADTAGALAGGVLLIRTGPLLSRSLSSPP
jgi:VanZ family protein